MLYKSNNFIGCEAFVIPYRLHVYYHKSYSIPDKCQKYSLILVNMVILEKYSSSFIVSSIAIGQKKSTYLLG
jgi:hypothetical protein